VGWQEGNCLPVLQQQQQAADCTLQEGQQHHVDGYKNPAEVDMSVKRE
jgi:hypothetical protein